LLAAVSRDRLQAVIKLHPRKNRYDTSYAKEYFKRI
jgi:hypothetical protein